MDYFVEHRDTFPQPRGVLFFIWVWRAGYLASLVMTIDIYVRLGSCGQAVSGGVPMHTRRRQD